MTLTCTPEHGVNLAQGICDTGGPPVEVDAVKQAVEQGIKTYIQIDGLAEWCQAVAQRRNAPCFLLEKTRVAGVPEVPFFKETESLFTFALASPRRMKIETWHVRG